MKKADRPFARIIEQAQKAMADVPLGGLEDEPLGMYGVTRREVRLGNIVAIALTTLRSGEEA